MNREIDSIGELSDREPELYREFKDVYEKLKKFIEILDTAGDLSYKPILKQIKNCEERMGDIINTLVEEGSELTKCMRTVNKSNILSEIQKKDERLSKNLNDSKNEPKYSGNKKKVNVLMEKLLNDPGAQPTPEENWLINDYPNFPQYRLPFTKPFYQNFEYIFNELRTKHQLSLDRFGEMLGIQNPYVTKMLIKPFSHWVQKKMKIIKGQWKVHYDSVKEKFVMIE